MSSNHCETTTDLPLQMAYALQENIERLIKSMSVAEQKPNNAPSQDPVIEQLVAELRRRSEIGLKKYGAPLSREDFALKDWLRHALEETLDNAGYLQAAINSLESGQAPTASDPLKEPIPDASQRFLALMYGLKI